ncbi:Isochorismatase-like protein [Mrakia frigida]|uniref:cysteine hydrolase family protein n=1 Tax=Mrakia frigida TaxID=29902 RepID=UPI003FCC18D9
MSSRIIIGELPNQWILDEGVWDLTRASSLPSIKINTTKLPIKIVPSKSALVIIDMQNFFLSPLLRSHPTGLACVPPLLSSAVPAAISSGMHTVFLNWGLTEDSLKKMPPALQRSFSRDVLDQGNVDGIYRGLGTDLGEGRGGMLMKGSWNAELYDGLREVYEKGLEKVDWVDKDRLSGLWGSGTPFELYLQQRGIATLFFAGVNSNQCVSGTLLDAHSKGYDCILLSDCSATASPQAEHDLIVSTCEKSWGWVCNAEDLGGMEG